MLIDHFAGQPHDEVTGAAWADRLQHPRALLFLVAGVQRGVRIRPQCRGQRREPFDEFRTLIGRGHFSGQSSRQRGLPARAFMAALAPHGGVDQFMAQRVIRLLCKSLDHP